MEATLLVLLHIMEAATEAEAMALRVLALPVLARTMDAAMEEAAALPVQLSTTEAHTAGSTELETEAEVTMEEGTEAGTGTEARTEAGTGTETEMALETEMGAAAETGAATERGAATAIDFDISVCYSRPVRRPNRLSTSRKLAISQQDPPWRCCLDPRGWKKLI